MLLISTPDVRSLLARLFRRRWHYYNRYHFSYLSRTTLAAIARRHGFGEVAFARLPRMKSLGYLFQYFVDFMAGGGRIRLPERVNAFVVPINLHDTMYVVFERLRDEAVPEA